MNLILRSDSTFELTSSNIISSETRKGNYSIFKNKIIFHSKAYENDFIPDTLKILGDTIPLSFNVNGKPKNSFAEYFVVSFNKLIEYFIF